MFGMFLLIRTQKTYKYKKDLGYPKSFNFSGTIIISVSNFYKITYNYRYNHIHM
jgi:hypothetical protein